MAHVRDSARSFGKSDPIDGLAVARAALREPNLPIARLDGVERELRLLVDHREDLVAERTRIIARLRWHLHEIDPGMDTAGKTGAPQRIRQGRSHLSVHPTAPIVRRLALRLVEHLRLLTDEIDKLTAEITQRVTTIAPSLLAIVGCGALTAAKIIGETAHAGRFRSKDAYARHNGTAPLPVWSSNKQRHRLHVGAYCSFAGTASTGQGATWRSRCVTLPRRSPLSGPCPRVPTTMRSAPASLALSAVMCAAFPATAE